MSDKRTIEEIAAGVPKGGLAKPVPMPKMVGDRLLIRRDEHNLLEGHKALQEAGFEVDEKTQERERPLTGVVLALSPRILANNPCILPDGTARNQDKQEIMGGDRIAYAAYASDTTIDWNGEELVVLTIDDVLCVIPE